MGSNYYKTTYNTEGMYGSTEEKTLYTQHSRSTDIVSFYDEDGDLIFSVPDTLDNNMVDAIVRLYNPNANHCEELSSKQFKESINKKQ